MKITFDKRADAIYIYLTQKKVTKTEELDANTFVDYDQKGEVVGIELLGASKRVPLKQLSKIASIKQTR